MHSWRDTASERAQHDLDGLLHLASPFAQQMLAEHGEFFPYGVGLGITGDRRMLAGDPGLGERPDSKEVLATLVQGVRSNREGYVAVAFVSDVRTSESDAVRSALVVLHRPSHLGRRAMSGIRRYRHAQAASTDTTCATCPLRLDPRMRNVQAQTVDSISN